MRGDPASSASGLTWTRALVAVWLALVVATAGAGCVDRGSEEVTTRAGKSSQPAVSWSIEPWAGPAVVGGLIVRGARGDRWMLGRDNPSSGSGGMRLWRSSNGLDWSPVDTSGGGPAGTDEISGLAATGSTVALAGVRRASGARAAAGLWTSTDRGGTWSWAPLRDDGAQSASAEGSPGQTHTWDLRVVSAARGFVVSFAASPLGTPEPQATLALFRTDDGVTFVETTPEAVDLPVGTPEVTIARRGDELTALVSVCLICDEFGPEIRMLRSSDDGRSWSVSPAPRPPELGAAFGYLGDRLLYAGFTEPDRNPVMLATGGGWQTVDLGDVVNEKLGEDRKWITARPAALGASGYAAVIQEFEPPPFGQIDRSGLDSVVAWTPDGAQWEVTRVSELAGRLPGPPDTVLLDGDSIVVPLHERGSQQSDPSRAMVGVVKR